MSDESAYISSERVERLGVTGVITIFQDSHGYSAVFRCSCGQSSSPARGVSMTLAAEQSKRAFELHCDCHHPP